MTQPDNTSPSTDPGPADQALALENAILRAAPRYGANAEALLDSSAFWASARDIHPADTKGIRDAIESAVKGSARFRAVQTTGTSGADFSNGFGERPAHPASYAPPGYTRVAAAFL